MFSPVLRADPIAAKLEMFETSTVNVPAWAWPENKAAAAAAARTSLPLYCLENMVGSFCLNDTWSAGHASSRNRLASVVTFISRNLQDLTPSAPLDVGNTRNRGAMETRNGMQKPDRNWYSVRKPGATRPNQGVIDRPLSSRPPFPSAGVRVGCCDVDQGGRNGHRRGPDRVPADLVHGASDPGRLAA